MIRTILLDCDDVLLNWLEGFAFFCADKLGKVIDTRGPDDWVMDKWLGTEPHETIQLIEEFNASEGFANLGPVEGAQAALMQFCSTSLRFHAITSCSSDWDTVEMRKANLKRHYAGLFDSVHCLDLGQSKEAVLHAFDAPCIWVEDNLKNALIGVKAGHKTFMRQTSHNHRHRAEAEANGITWFTHWDELKLEEHL
jgi:FMN phosphatase YigB (HAD superfamily)